MLHRSFCSWEKTSSDTWVQIFGDSTSPCSFKAAGKEEDKKEMVELKTGFTGSNLKKKADKLLMNYEMILPHVTHLFDNCSYVREDIQTTLDYTTLFSST